MALGMLIAVVLGLLFGERTDSVAQSTAVQVVRVCSRGAAVCNSLMGRTLNLAQSQEGSVAIPQGCGVISRDRTLTLRTYASSVVIRTGEPAASLAGLPTYDNPRVGDQIQINADNQQCCLSEAGDKVVNCTNMVGEKVVRVMIGPRR